MKDSRVVATGFDAYGSISPNPSARVVMALHLDGHQKEQLVREVLSTSYQTATIRINQLLLQYRPNVLLMFGHSSRAHALQLERYAHNRTTSTLLDNDGDCSTGPIDPSGPFQYVATLDVYSIMAIMRRSGLSTVISDNAGGYVCNYVYYHALRTIERELFPTRCLFVHIPTITTEEAGRAIQATAQTLLDTVTCLPELPAGSLSRWREGSAPAIGDQ